VLPSEVGRFSDAATTHAWNTPDAGFYESPNKHVTYVAANRKRDIEKGKRNKGKAAATRTER
jgi:hypothetical protein